MKRKMLIGLWFLAVTIIANAAIAQESSIIYLEKLEPLLQEKVRFGGESSGGGAAIICRDQNDSITSVEMLDTYEGKILYGLNYYNDTRPYMDQVYDHIAKLSFDRGFVIDMKKVVKEIQEDILYLPAGVLIHAPGDLGDKEAVIVPNGCEINGVGYYEKKTSYGNKAILRVSADLFNKMSEFQKATFILHEALYSLYRFYFSDIREDPEYSAKKTRVFLAHLLTTQTGYSLEDNKSAFRWTKMRWTSYTDPLFFQNKDGISLRLTNNTQSNRGYSHELGCMTTASFHTRGPLYNGGPGFSWRRFNLNPGAMAIIDISEGCIGLVIKSSSYKYKWMQDITMELIDKNNNVLRALTESDLSGESESSDKTEILLPLYAL